MDYDTYNYFIVYVYEEEPNGPEKTANFKHTSRERLTSYEAFLKIQDKIKEENGYNRVTINFYQLLV